MAIHVVQGERDLVSACRSLARFELRGIPPMTAGAARIRVTFQVDADGLLSVSAREMSAGVEAHVTVKPSYGLSDDEVTQMLKAGVEHAGDDAQARAVRELQVEGRRMIEVVTQALAVDGELLSDEERNGVDQAIAALNVAVGQDDGKQLRQCLDTLGRATDTFASRRMDKSIRKALAGQNVNELKV